MQLFESACICVRSPVYSCTTQESIDKFIFIGLVEAHVDVVGMSAINRNEHLVHTMDVWCDGRTGHSMSLFIAVLHASQSLCHELKCLTNKHVLRKR